MSGAEKAQGRRENDALRGVVGQSRALDSPTHTDLLIQVVGVHLDYVSADTTGLVEGGYVELRGQAGPFRMVVRHIRRLRQLLLSVDGTVVKDPAKEDWEAGPLVRLDVGQASFDDENDGETLCHVPAQKQKSPRHHVSYLLPAALDASRSTFRGIGVALTAEAAEIEVRNRPAPGQARSGKGSDASGGVRTVGIV